MWGKAGLMRLVAVMGLVLMAFMATGSLTTRTAQAEEPTGENRCQVYGDLFMTYLAGELGVGREQLTADMKMAAKQTIDSAVANEDLGAKQGERLKSKVDTGTFCAHHGMHGGMYGGMYDYSSTEGSAAKPTS